MKFTDIVGKIDESCDVSDVNIRMAHGHIILSGHNAQLSLETRESNI